MTTRWLLLGCIGAIAAATVAIRPGVDSVRTESTPGERTAPPPPGRLDLVAADPGRGRPVYAQRYGPEVHGGHRQSWDAAQTDDGMLYIANTHGILEFDGVSWTLIPTPLGLIRTVVVLTDGRVYAGGEHGMGVVEPDAVGVNTFRELVSSDSLGGEAVWGIFEVENAVVLQTLGRLARVEDERITSTLLAPEGRRFHKAFRVVDRLMVRLEGAGLLEYADGALRPVPGGERFADVPVRALVDLDGQPGGDALAVTNDELFRLNTGGLTPLSSAASDRLRDGRAYHGCRVGDGPDALVAITTFGQGALLVDARGTLVQHLGAEVGLTADGMVLGCTADARGGLWLALSDGVLRVDAAAPLSVFGAADGLPGAIYDIARSDGRLYVGTEHGVFRQTVPREGETPRFEAVAPDQSLVQSWSLYPTAEGLLVASTGGVYAVDGLTARRIMDGPAYSFTERASDGAPELLVGLKSRIGVLRAAGGWHAAGALVQTEGEIRAFTVTGDATWAMEREGRLLRIEGARVDAFGAAEGIPEDVVTTQALDDRLLLLSRETVYTADPERLGRGGGVRTDGALTALARTVSGAESDVSYYALSQDATGRVWISGTQRTVAVERRGGQWVDVTPAPFRTLAQILPTDREGRTTLVGNGDGLYRLVGDGARYDQTEQVFVRSLTAEDDGVLSGGAAREGALAAPYGQALRFGFALPAFNDADGTEYRSFLEGFDRRPNAWGPTAQREYTNLPPGDYTFRVEARTAQGTVAQPAALAFTIPPPWYLSRWAFGGYVVLVVLFVGGIATLSSRHERRKTVAAAARAAELAELNEQLREADRLKDDMLANTSHELRTPLTAILGFSEILQEYEGGNPAEVRELASHMFSGGQRLLHTVNDLLDIAQLRAGKLTLKPRLVDAAAVVRTVAAELRPLADEKALAFSVHPAGLSVPAHLDPEAFARVLINLISNAIKFTDRGGVAVLVDAEGETLRVTVQDSGIGIAPAFIPHLFDEYVQESTGHGRRAEGSGLGLAITRRVVTLMGGTIDVASEPGRGSRFTVHLPVQAQASPGVPVAPPGPAAGQWEAGRRQGASRTTDQPEAARR